MTRVAIDGEVTDRPCCSRRDAWSPTTPSRSETAGSADRAEPAGESRARAYRAIDQRRCMPRIEIKRRKLHPQVQLWMVVQLAGVIPLQTLGEAPLKKILHCRVIKSLVE